MKYRDGEFSAAGWTKILSRWTKGGNDRVYINNDNRKTCGYVDLKTREVHWQSGYDRLPGAAEYAEEIMRMEF